MIIRPSRKCGNNCAPLLLLLVAFSSMYWRDVMPSLGGLGRATASGDDVIISY